MIRHHTSRKQGDLNLLEAGYEEKALHPPSSSGESKWGGAWAKAGFNKTEAVGADRRRSRDVITLISKNSGIDYFFFP